MIGATKLVAYCRIRGDYEVDPGRQCELLDLARSGVYWWPAPANDNDLAVLRRIDEPFTT